MNGIFVKGARENNLKNIDVFIPYHKLTAVIGLSGSGKSSLVNDTIYQECKRKMEYLSFNRSVNSKPNVDYISGIMPAILINQNQIRGNSYSTIGTYTNCYDYLRIIYSTIGIRHCPDCGHEIIPLTKNQILTLVKDKAIYDINNQLMEKGNFEENVNEALNKDKALKILVDDEFIVLQTSQKCYHCDKLMFEITPSTFSYTNQETRCPICNGLGQINEIDLNKIIKYPELSLLEGAIPFYGKLKTFLQNPNANWMKGQVIAICQKEKIDLNLAWYDLPETIKNKILYGTDYEVTFEFYNKKNGRKGDITRKVEGLVNILKRICKETSDPKLIEKYFSKVICPACHGEKLNKEGRMVTVLGKRYPEISRLTFNELREFCLSLINCDKCDLIKSSIDNLLDITSAAQLLGIDYLSLNRSTVNISSGEAQRIKILGAYLNHLSNILYIFDEPSKGLDPRDYLAIQNMFTKLLAENNTIVMVEHNMNMIQLADNIIEIGPCAGSQGGYIIDNGPLKKLLNNNKTEISKYFYYQPNKVHRELKEFVELKNLHSNNLKNIDLRFPKNAITTIFGVSGSGKSTLLKKEIYPKMLESDLFNDCILVDSLPIGKNIKSIIATYIGIMDIIRSLFKNTQEAIQKGYDEKFFSFNQDGGCPTCNGDGRIEVKFLNESYIECPDCHGSRYNNEVLKIKYQNKNIREILDLEINEALSFFKNDEMVRCLSILNKVGLGYLKIGQATSTLSGGEATRLKLAKELLKGKKTNTLFLLDEPTTGLHFSDIDNLIKLINELVVDNTIIVIEHNEMFMKASDILIELGPGAGEKGGYIINK